MFAFIFSLAIALSFASLVIVARDIYIEHVRKVGGIHHWHCMSFGGSLYRSRHWKGLSTKRVGGMRHFTLGGIGGSIYVRRAAPAVTKTRIAFALNMH